MNSEQECQKQQISLMFAWNKSHFEFVIFFSSTILVQTFKVIVSVSRFFFFWGGGEGEIAGRYSCRIELSSEIDSFCMCMNGHAFCTGTTIGWRRGIFLYVGWYFLNERHTVHPLLWSHFKTLLHTHPTCIMNSQLLECYFPQALMIFFHISLAAAVECLEVIRSEGVIHLEGEEGGEQKERIQYIV